jgi:putative membrane protein
MASLLIRGACAIIGFWLATQWVSGVSFDDSATLLFSGLLLGVINAALRPVLVILTLPITVVTLGLFLLVINAATVALVAWLLPGMHVANFHAALMSALLVSIVSWIGNTFARS